MENEDDPNTTAPAAEVTPDAPTPEQAPEAEAAAIPQEIYNQIDTVGYNTEGREYQRAQQEIDGIARSMMATDNKLQGNMNEGLQGMAGMNIIEMIQQFFGMDGGSGGGNSIQNMSGRVFEAFQNGDITAAGDMPAGGVAEGLIQDVLNMAPQGPTPQAPTTDPQLQTPSM